MLINATMPLADLRRLRHDQVNRLRAEKLAAGFVHNGKAYNADPQSMANIGGTMAAVSAGIPLPVGFSWRAADNTDTPMDAAAFSAFAAAAFNFVNAVYAASWAIKDAIESSDTPAQVDIAQGWPT